VFTDLPPYASWAGIVRTTLPPGAEWSVGTRDDTGVGPLLVRVESGSLTVQSDGPLTFSRAGAVSAATAQPKERVVLRPDDRAFAPSGVSTRLRNGGSEPTTFLVAGITADHEPFALLDQAALIEEHLHTPLAAPVAVAARRITLDAGAAVPLAAWPGLRMLGVESGRVEAVTPSATGTPTALPIANATTNDPFFTPETVLRNVGDEPATLWALTIQPADPMSAPAASPP
jgi:hypothetical protein